MKPYIPDVILFVVSFAIIYWLVTAGIIPCPRCYSLPTMLEKIIDHKPG